MICRYLLSYTDVRSVVFTEAMNAEPREAQLTPVSPDAAPSDPWARLAAPVPPAPCCPLSLPA